MRRYTLLVVRLSVGVPPPAGAALRCPPRVPPSVVAPSTVGRRLLALDDLVDARAVKADGLADLRHREAGVSSALEALPTLLGRVVELRRLALELRLRPAGLGASLLLAVSHPPQPRGRRRTPPPPP